jgi:hypothetical protein
MSRSFYSQGVELEVGWAAELVWTFWRRQKFPTSVRNLTQYCSSHSLVTVLIILSWHLQNRYKICLIIVYKYIFVAYKITIKRGASFQSQYFWSNIQNCHNAFTKVLKNSANKLKFNCWLWCHVVWSTGRHTNISAQQWRRRSISQWPTIQ